MPVIKPNPVNPSIGGSPSKLSVVYDAEGNESVDAREMLRSGNYFAAPPGEPQPNAEPARVQRGS